ncbi:hypothetical protein D030_1617B, partial [Vibrio parahaemolyticus AQ3810]
FQVCVVP